MRATQFGKPLFMLLCKRIKCQSVISTVPEPVVEASELVTMRDPILPNAAMKDLRYGTQIGMSLDRIQVVFRFAQHDSSWW